MGPAHNVQKYTKEIVPDEWMFIVTELFDIDGNDFGAKKSVRCDCIFVLTIFFISRANLTKIC